MSEIEFKKNWLAVAGIFVLFASFPVLAFLGFLWKVVLYWQTGFWDIKFNSVNLMLTLMATIVFTFCAWMFTSVLTIKFTDEGVWQRNLLRWNFIAWKNITYAEEIPYGVTLYEGQKKMRLFLAFFADLNEVLSFIKERISANATF